MSGHTEDHGHGHETEKEGIYFEESTVVIGTLFVIVALCVLCSLVFL
jgi:hypothetical protein